MGHDGLADRGRDKSRSGRAPPVPFLVTSRPERSRPARPVRPILSPAARNASVWLSGRPETATTSSRRRASPAGADPRPEDLVEVQRFPSAAFGQRVGRPALDVPDQLVDEEWVAPRLARDGLRPLARATRRPGRVISSPGLVPPSRSRLDGQLARSTPASPPAD